MSNYTLRMMSCFLACCVTTSIAKAGLLDKLLREAGEAALKTGGRELIERGSSSAARKIAVEAAESAAKRQASQTLLSMGDDALRLAGSSRAAAMLADDAARVVARVTPRNARRLAMMADDIEKSGKTPALFRHLAENAAADQAVDFLWRNKGTLMTGAAITTVMMHPEVLTEPATRLGETAIETTVQEIVRPATGGTALGTWMFIVVGVLAVASGLAVWTGSRRLRRWSTWLAITNVR